MRGLMKTTPTLSKVRTVSGVTEYKLSNGLRVLYRREKAAPVVAVCVTFHVGSRNEAPGHTGATHILEHLLFKDSKKFNKKNKKAITDYLEWFGAKINASTWLDCTNYHELLPSEHAEAAIELEADRMRGSLFSDADLASEMTVVRNEYERSRNNPFELLEEEMWGAAFTEHPYRIPTIGLKEDIEGSTAKKLREFYDQYYWPNNATVAIYGDISAKDAEALVLKHFGPIPSSPEAIPEMTIVEPVQTESRAVSIAKPFGVSIVSLGYKIPEATHEDSPAVLALATILADGFSSRLQKKLVDTGLATDVSVSVPELRDPGFMTFTAQINEGVDLAKALTTMRKEILSVLKTPPDKQELARAVERILSHIAYDRDGVLTEVRAVSEAIAAGDWMLVYRAEEHIKAVRPSDILRVAKQYLVASGETSGILKNIA